MLSAETKGNQKLQIETNPQVSAENVICVGHTGEYNLSLLNIKLTTPKPSMCEVHGIVDYTGKTLIVLELLVNSPDYDYGTLLNVPMKACLLRGGSMTNSTNVAGNIPLTGHSCNYSAIFDRLTNLKLQDTRVDQEISVHVTVFPLPSPDDIIKFYDQLITLFKNFRSEPLSFSGSGRIIIFVRSHHNRISSVKKGYYDGIISHLNDLCNPSKCFWLYDSYQEQPVQFTQFMSDILGSTKNPQNEKSTLIIDLSKIDVELVKMPNSAILMYSPDNVEGEFLGKTAGGSTVSITIPHTGNEIQIYFLVKCSDSSDHQLVGTDEQQLIFNYIANMFNEDFSLMDLQKCSTMFSDITQSDFYSKHFGNVSENISKCLWQMIHTIMLEHFTKLAYDVSSNYKKHAKFTRSVSDVNPLRPLIPTTSVPVNRDDRALCPPLLPRRSVSTMC